MKNENQFPKPKILMICTELDFGGVEIGILKRAVALKDFGYDPEFACLHKLGKVGEELKLKGFKVHNLNSSPKVQSLTTLIRLIKLLRQIKPDIVHAACIEANFHSLIASKILGKIKVIVEEVGILVDGRGQFVRSWKGRQLGRFVWNNADCVLAVAESVKQSMIETEAAPDWKVKVLPYSIDLAYLKNSQNGNKKPSDNEIIIGCVARLSPEKGQRVLLKAFKRAAENYDNLRLWLIGDGPDREHLTKMADELGIADRIKFWGVRRDIPELLGQMDMFVLASYWEGLPNAVLEAMASSVPVIASEVGGLPEIIEQRKNGVMAPVGDDNAFAQEIIKMVNLDDSERKRMVNEAKRMVEEKFSPQVVTKQFSDLYISLIQAS